MLPGKVEARIDLALDRIPEPPAVSNRLSPEDELKLAPAKHAKYLSRVAIEEWKEDVEYHRARCHQFEKDVRYLEPRVAELEQAARSIALSAFVTSALVVAGSGAISAATAYTDNAQKFLFYLGWAAVVGGLASQGLMAYWGQSPKRKRDAGR